MKRVLRNALLILALAFSLSASAFAQEGGSRGDRNADRELPESVSALKLDDPVKLSDVPARVLHASLRNAEGLVKVIVRLTADSVAEAKGKAQALGPASQEAQAQQNAFVRRAYALDSNAREIARVQHVLNAVFLEIDASVLPQLAKDPTVERIAPIGPAIVRQAADGVVLIFVAVQVRRKHSHVVVDPLARGLSGLHPSLPST